MTDKVTNAVQYMESIPDELREQVGAMHQGLMDYPYFADRTYAEREAAFAHAMNEHNAVDGHIYRVAGRMQSLSHAFLPVQRGRNRPDRFADLPGWRDVPYPETPKGTHFRFTLQVQDTDPFVPFEYADEQTRTLHLRYAGTELNPTSSSMVAYIYHPGQKASIHLEHQGTLEKLRGVPGAGRYQFQLPTTYVPDDALVVAVYHRGGDVDQSFTHVTPVLSAPVGHQGALNVLLNSRFDPLKDMHEERANRRSLAHQLEHV